MDISQTSYLLASPGLPLDDLPAAIEIRPIGAAMAAARWQGPRPICVLLAKVEKDRFYKSELGRYLKSANLPVIEVPEDVTAKVLSRIVMENLLLDRARWRQGHGELQAENAALRRDYMKLQQSFSRTEDFLLAAMAPEFSCARDWPYAGAALPAGTYTQRLPAGSAGLLAVDIWAMEAGEGCARFCRLTGEDFAEEIPFAATRAGWVRLCLPEALSGLAEDVVLCLESDIPLGLSLPTPLAMFHVGEARSPLALRVWKGLQGVSLPEMRPEAKRFILPASGLPEPEILQGGSAKPLREREAIALHPGHDGKLDLVFRGVEVPRPANIAAYLQNFGPETVTVSLGLMSGPTARPIYLPAGAHRQCDLDIGAAGPVDLRFELRAPSGVASVFLRGLEFCGMGG